MEKEIIQQIEEKADIGSFVHIGDIAKRKLKELHFEKLSYEILQSFTSIYLQDERIVSREVKK